MGCGGWAGQWGVPSSRSAAWVGLQACRPSPPTRVLCPLLPPPPHTPTPAVRGPANPQGLQAGSVRPGGHGPLPVQAAHRGGRVSTAALLAVTSCCPPASPRPFQSSHLPLVAGDEPPASVSGSSFHFFSFPPRLHPPTTPAPAPGSSTSSTPDAAVLAPHAGSCTSTTSATATSSWTTRC